MVDEDEQEEDDEDEDGDEDGRDMKTGNPSSTFFSKSSPAGSYVKE